MPTPSPLFSLEALCVSVACFDPASGHPLLWSAAFSQQEKHGAVGVKRSFDLAVV
jgi:hypothetical protein